MTYTQGVLENSIPSVGQVAGRIETLVPVAEIIEKTVNEFAAVISQLQKRYLRNS
jgi:enoyl-[acyl-carrier protein] reductase II